MEYWLPFRHWASIRRYRLQQFRGISEGLGNPSYTRYEDFSQTEIDRQDGSKAQRFDDAQNSLNLS